MDTNQPVNAETKSAQKFNLLEFIRDTRREIAKVTWPTRRETMVTTAMIVGSALLVGLFFFVIDSVLGLIISRILGMKG